MRTPSIAWIVLVLLLFAASAVAQFPSSRQSQPSPPPPPTIDPSADAARERQAADFAKKANLDRQAALRNDTDKLLKLAVELKDYVDKTNENVLSLDVVKKCEEIEKLAHSVKDKMKGPN